MIHQFRTTDIAPSHNGQAISYRGITQTGANKKSLLLLSSLMASRNWRRARTIPRDRDFHFALHDLELREGASS